METLGRGVTFQVGCGRSRPAESALELILAPAMTVDEDLRAVHELLEMLDDAMFAAIEGDEVSGKRARELWHRASTSLHDELLEESREHYLAFASEALRPAGRGGVRNPTQLLAAIEVIELLTT